jgi:hypothetical protein
MPNHIKNKIELIGELSEIDALIKKFSTYLPAHLNMTHDGKHVICKNKGEGYSFCWLDLSTGHVHDRADLNQIGLPPDYEMEITDGVLLFPDFKKVIPPPDDPAYRDEPSQEVAQKSPNWWYEWNIEHWGSKWGGYDFERLAINVFTFDTAWSGCPIIIEAMSKAFPNITINYAWADEDTSHNCGRAVYHNGLISEEIPAGGTKEAYDIAFELRPDYQESYELVDGEYQYKESES